MNWIPEKREIEHVEIDLNQVKSGDFFAVSAMGGLDALIMYGTGSRISHSTMALWFDDGLFIVESNAGGIHRTPIEKRIYNSEDIMWIPLSDENAEKFNETAAREFFNITNGLSYGFHNFMFGWFDTPEDNNPPLLPHKMVPILWKIVSDVDSDISDKFYMQAMNKHLGTTNLTLTQMVTEAAKRNLTLEEI